MRIVRSVIMNSDEDSGGAENPKPGKGVSKKEREE